MSQRFFNCRFKEDIVINFTDPMFSNRVLGFETLVDRLERISNESQSSYPPYNIYKDGLKFQIEIALAGIDKKDVDIELCDGILITQQWWKQIPIPKQYTEECQKSFKLKFTLAEDLEVIGRPQKMDCLQSI